MLVVSMSNRTNVESKRMKSSAKDAKNQRSQCLIEPMWNQNLPAWGSPHPTEYRLNV